MSFPFVQPYFGLGNSLQTAQGAAGGGAVGGWVELARTTLGSSAGTIDVSSLPDKRYYMICRYIISSGDTVVYNRLNADSGSNYSYRWSEVGLSDGTGTSQTQVIYDTGGDPGDKFDVTYISNLAGKEKLAIGHQNNEDISGASNPPVSGEAAWKWTNTSDAIDQLTTNNTGQSGSYDTGSEVVVLGWDPADTHTTNFWEELASVTLGSDGDVLSSGTIDAKKYLWVQAFIKNSGTSARYNTQMTFNNDTGANYAERRSLDGSMSTAASQSNIMSSGVTGSDDDLWCLNMFVVNNSATEKLCIGHGFDTYAGSGAGTAPSQRFEKYAKWANTSSQITNITITNSDTSNYDAISELRVWGSD